MRAFSLLLLTACAALAPTSPCWVEVAPAAAARSRGAAPAGIPLQNAADAGVVMPWSGAGSGGYTGTAAHFGEYPENWDACADPQCLAPDPPGFNSSALAVEAALYTYLVLGGRRIDSSASYHSQAHAGAALSTSRLARGDVFFTSKVGPFLAMGGPEARQQFAGIIATSPWLEGRVDLLLIHWPSCIPAEGGSSCPNATSSEPICQVGGPQYSSRLCRLSTWRALVDIWKQGGARAIGVSNYNASHLEEIKAAGLPMPAVNQIPYNIYSSSKQDETVAYCKANGIVVNGYSPYGVPDHRSYSPPQSPTMLVDPVVTAVAAAHGVSPAVAMLAWQYQLGIPFNPRSMNAAHVLENLGLAGTAWWQVQLTPTEMQQMSSRPQI